MVENEHMEGQGWSTDHLAWLSLSLILVWDLEVEGPKIYEAFFGNTYFIQIKFRNEKENVGYSAEAVTSVDTGKWILYFVKVGYYPLLPLACASI